MIQKTIEKKMKRTKFLKPIGDDEKFDAISVLDDLSIHYDEINKKSKKINYLLTSISESNLFEQKIKDNLKNGKTSLIIQHIMNMNTIKLI